MRLISRHILGTIAVPFCWGVAALTGLMLMQSLPPLIDSFGGRGLPPGVMFEAILLFIPTLLSLTLPMAVLVSTLYAYSQMAANLEMVAMYANGVSVWRMARPALIGAAIIGLANFFLFDQLAPKTMMRFANLRRSAINTSPTMALKQQVLNQLPAPAGYILKAEQIDPVNGHMKHVTIFDLSVPDTRREIVADSGSMAESEDGTDLILTLHSGTIYQFTRTEPGRLQETNFVHDRIYVRGAQTQFQKINDTALVNRSDPEKSGCELLDAAASQRWTRDNNAALNEFYTRSDLRALTGLPAVLRPAIRQPVLPPHCGIYRRFGNWFRSVMLPARASAQQPPPPAQQPPTQQPVPQQGVPQQPIPGPPQPPAPSAVIDSLHQAGVVPANPVLTQPQGFLVPPAPPLSTFGDVNAVAMSSRQAQTSLLGSRAEFHRRVAISLASFCFVLIGLALALKYPNSGIGLVIGASLIIFLGFYILLQGGVSVAKTGVVNPIIALYSPLVLLTSIGLAAVAAADREMGSSRSSGVFSALTSLFRRKR